jgi:hypothetical protein
MSEEVKWLTDIFGQDCKTIPVPVLAMVVCRLLPYMNTLYPKLADRALEGAFLELRPALGRIVTDPDTRRSPAALAAMFFEAYFVDSGDWKAMERGIAKIMVEHTGIPEAITRLMVDRIYAIKSEGLKDSVELFRKRGLIP